VLRRVLCFDIRPPLTLPSGPLRASTVSRSSRRESVLAIREAPPHKGRDSVIPNSSPVRRRRDDAVHGPLRHQRHRLSAIAVPDGPVVTGDRLHPHTSTHSGSTHGSTTRPST